MGSRVLQRWLVLTAIAVVGLFLIVLLGSTPGNTITVVFVAIVAASIYLLITAEKPPKHPKRIRGDEAAPD